MSDPSVSNDLKSKIWTEKGEKTKFTKVSFISKLNATMG